MSLRIGLISLLSVVALAIAGHRLFYFHQPLGMQVQGIEAHHGDLIFRQGKGVWSPYFAGLNSSTGFSHVGVLIQSGEGFDVLHADADDISQVGGVQKTPLSQFVQESLTVKVKSNHMPQQLKDAFIRHLVPMHEQHLAFDSNFEINDNGSRVYRPEYVWLAAMRAGIKDLGEVITLMGKDLILVDSIYQSRWIN